MLCPVDDSSLLPSSFGDYQIHRCTQCQGALISGKLAPAVRAHAALEMHKMQGHTAQAILCPSDGTQMKALSYKAVAICVCPQCFGIWSDADQLSRLLELIGPPKQADLSKIGRNLATIRDGKASASIEGIGDIVEFSVDALNAIDALKKLAD